MREWAFKGKRTMGWFYGFKLNLAKNKGEIIQWQLTQGNVDDSVPLKDSIFTERLFGKLFANRGYISQDLFEILSSQCHYRIAIYQLHYNKPIGRIKYVLI